MQKQNKSILVVLGVTLLLGVNHNNSLLKGAGPTTVTVLPSGDPSGITDWNNLNAAFEEANALTGLGPGTTVKLASGTFYIDKPLLVSNFSGKLKGAGRVMDEGAEGTTITNALGVTFGLSDWSFTGFQNQIPQYPTFVTFYMDNSWDPEDEANIEVENLTAHWSAGTTESTTENWALELDQIRRDQLGAFFWVPGRLTGTLDPTEVSLVTTRFHMLELTAESALIPSQFRFGNTSVPEDAIAIFNLVTDFLDTDNDGEFVHEWMDIKPIIGNQEISNVHIENNRVPIFMTGIDDSEVLVKGVIVNNPDIVCGCFAVLICDNSNTAFTVTNLETTNAAGVAFPQGHWRDISQITASTYLLSHSTIQQQGRLLKIVLNDNVNRRTGIPTIKAKLEQNTLIGSGGGSASILSAFVDDLIVTKNIISGSGLRAIRVFGGKDGVIHDNQVSDFNSDAADIFLQRTSGFIVFGNDLTDTVLDQFGMNNTIVNANGIPKSALDKETEREMNKRLREF